MQVSNPAITDRIQAISDHFRTNFANHYTIRALDAVMPQDAGGHSLIAMFTEPLADYALQGLHLEDLYLSMEAMAQLIGTIRAVVLPDIRSLVYADVPRGQPKPPDKVLRDMAIANFEPNLRILAERLRDLAALVQAWDREQAGGRPPVFRRYPGVAAIDSLIGE